MAKFQKVNKDTTTPEVKENNVDPALREEIDRDLGVLAGTGEQPYGEQPHIEGEREFVEAGLEEIANAAARNAEDRLGSFENPLPDLTEKPKEEEAPVVARVYLDIPLPEGRRRYSKRREEYKDWPVGKAWEFKNFKTNPVNAVLYPLVDDGWKFQSQKQGEGDEPGTNNYVVWRKA
jgi:hypothetical protein